MVSLPANDRIDDGIVFYFEKLEFMNEETADKK